MECHNVTILLNDPTPRTFPENCSYPVGLECLANGDVAVVYPQGYLYILNGDPASFHPGSSPPFTIAGGPYHLVAADNPEITFNGVTKYTLNRLALLGTWLEKYSDGTGEHQRVHYYPEFQADFIHYELHAENHQEWQSLSGRGGKPLD